MKKQKQFLEELKSKNMEEKKKLEESKKEEKEDKKPEAKDTMKEDNKDKTDDTKINNFEKDTAKIKPSDVKENTNSDKNSNKKKSLIPQNLKLSVIDTAVPAVISLALLYLFDLILRLLFGYYIADMKGMYIILFLIVLVLYPVIMRSCKFRKTLGEKFTKASKKEQIGN